MTARGSITEHFRTGNIESHSLDPSGISEMTIVWKNLKIKATWYFSNRFRSLEIDGSAYPSSSDAELIVKAAAQRSKTILSEKLNALDNMV